LQHIFAIFVPRKPNIMEELFAHIITPDYLHPALEGLSLVSHSEGVAQLSSAFSSMFGFEDIGRIMGLLHDKGKEQTEWQEYLQGVIGFNKEYAHVKSGPNHSYVGAVIAQKLYPQIAPLIAQPIVGHHRVLYDYCEYIEDFEIVTPLVAHFAKTDVEQHGNIR